MLLIDSLDKLLVYDEEEDGGYMEPRPEVELGALAWSRFASRRLTVLTTCLGRDEFTDLDPVFRQMGIALRFVETAEAGFSYLSRGGPDAPEDSGDPF